MVWGLPHIPPPLILGCAYPRWVWGACLGTSWSSDAHPSPPGEVQVGGRLPSAVRISGKRGGGRTLQQHVRCSVGDAGMFAVGGSASQALSHKAQASVSPPVGHGHPFLSGRHGEPVCHSPHGVTSGRGARPPTTQGCPKGWGVEGGRRTAPLCECGSPARPPRPALGDCGETQESGAWPCAMCRSSRA